jgi:NAD(P)-dependent dehydrogenase (short-subunit alcohol dehydrogenase family)
MRNIVNGNNVLRAQHNVREISHSVRRAAAKIIALHLPIVGLLNNAGIMQMRPTRNALGWDMSFVTNHLGPFALTEALMPSLPNGANVLFVVSAVEDAERKPAVAAGFRGGRYISAEASARGEWKPGGATKPGYDAYATSKQAILAAAMAFGRETLRLHFNAIEPGLNPTAGLGGSDVGAFVRFLQRFHHPDPRATTHPLLQDLEHSEASRARDFQNHDRCVRSGQCLLRRRWPPDARLCTRARPEVPGPRRSRDTRLAVDDSKMKPAGLGLLWD